MKFTVGSAALLKALGKVAGAVPSRSTIPISENFLLDASGSRLTITTTNIELFMQTSIAVESSGDPVKIAVPPKTLMDILKMLPDQPVAFTINPEGWAVEIVSSSGTYTLSGYDGKDFPRIPAPDSTKSVRMGVKALVKSISKVLFAASTDPNKQSLNAVFIEVREDSTTFVATDAHRLVRQRLLGVGGSHADILAPRAAMALAKGAFAPSTGEVAIEHNTSNVLFRSDDLLLVCRLVDQQYPQYQHVIPESHTGSVTVGREALLGSIARISVFANSTSLLFKASFSESGIGLFTRDLDFARKAKEAVPCRMKGDAMDIGFSSEMLSSVVAAISSDEVRVEFSSPNRAVAVHPAEQDAGEDLLTLVFPFSLISLGEAEDS